MPLQTGVQCLGIFTKLGHHGNLPFLNNNKATGQPQANQHNCNKDKQLWRTFRQLNRAAAISAAPPVATATALASKQ